MRTLAAHAHNSAHSEIRFRTIHQQIRFLKTASMQAPGLLCESNRNSFLLLMMFQLEVLILSRCELGEGMSFSVSSCVGCQYALGCVAQGPLDRTKKTDRHWSGSRA